MPMDLLGGNLGPAPGTFGHIRRGQKNRGMRRDGQGGFVSFDGGGMGDFGPSFPEPTQRSSAKKPSASRPPPRPDLVTAQLQALNFARNERRIRQSSGRRGTFLTRGNIGTNILLGQ